MRVAIYWNKPPASIVTALSVNTFKKRLENVWTEVHLIRMFYQFIFYRVTEIIFVNEWYAGRGGRGGGRVA